MRFRQVHLDFHTSEHIPEIGADFSREQFAEALRTGHVDSITVFSKCHHGLSYHPTEVGEMHPNLSFDLLGEQIAAAHSCGVKTPVYLSAGFDELAARKHPEWLLRPKDDTVHWERAGYKYMCMNTPYLDYLIAQIEEAVRKYDCDAIFLDIVGVRVCYCRHCVDKLISEGKDPYDYKNAYELAERTYAEYARRVREAIDRIKPGLPLFHNTGHIRRGRRDMAHYNTHLELESLPTGGWGYDHFPLSAAYSATLGMDYLGMTGKFHTTWGEFGGFKHENALIYETALSAAFGAGCSVGDQLHPRGKMDDSTYSLIGKAYARIEEREKWLDGASSLADIAVFSAEAKNSYYGELNEVGLSSGNDAAIDSGVSRIMLEGKYLFHVADAECDLSPYKLVILPDDIRLDSHLTKKIKEYMKNGGKVLATGTSALMADKDEFALDLGAAFLGESEFSPSYMRPGFDCGYKDSAFVIYEKAYNIAPTDGKVVIEREDPYFNRTPLHFSSHMQTPNDPSKRLPAAVITENGAYIASRLFTEYARTASYITKRMLIGMIDMLIGNDKTVRTTLPSQGVVTLTEQASENRYVMHALFASPIKRGEGIEVIEDLIPLYNVKFALKLPKKVEPKRVYSAPDGAEIPYEVKDGVARFTADKIDCHFMAVVEY